jgi:hypothetical protein
MEELHLLACRPAWRKEVKVGLMEEPVQVEDGTKEAELQRLITHMCMMQAVMAGGKAGLRRYADYLLMSVLC